MEYGDARRERRTMCLTFLLFHFIIKHWWKFCTSYFVET
jgi:hypothetical protein